jgi:hypothetical protein
MTLEVLTPLLDPVLGQYVGLGLCVEHVMVPGPKNVGPVLLASAPAPSNQGPVPYGSGSGSD